MGFKIREYKDQNVQSLWYHGFVYYDFYKNKVVTYIIPLNWIVWILRQIWFALKLPPMDSTLEIYRDAYQSGWDDGYKEGYDDRQN